MLKGFKAGIFWNWPRYDLHIFWCIVLTRFSTQNSNKNILGIPDNMTYIISPPYVAVAYSGGGIVMNMLSSFSTSGPLVCAKLKLRQVPDADGSGTY